MNPILDVVGGIAGPVISILKGLGIIKDPELEAKVATQLAELEIRLEEALTKRIEAINATMQAEAKSDKWPQYAWRPLIGFTFAGVVLNNYILIPYFHAYGMVPIVIPDGVWTAMLVTLGVSAGTRGWEKVEKAKNGR